MSLFERNTAGSRDERSPEVPRVQIQGEDAVIPQADGTEGERVPVPKKTWG